MKHVLVKTKHSENDCDECCFALACINPCRIKKGYHYEEKKSK